MKESLIESRLVRAVRLSGGKSIKLAPLDKGVPDRLVMWPGGRTEFVELKAEGGRLSPAQKLWHERALAIGHHVTVLTGIEEVEEWLEIRTMVG